MTRPESRPEKHIPHELNVPAEAPTILVDFGAPERRFLLQIQIAGRVFDRLKSALNHHGLTLEKAGDVIEDHKSKKRVGEVFVVAAVGVAAAKAAQTIYGHLKDRKPQPLLNETQVAEFSKLYARSNETIFKFIFFRVDQKSEAEDLTTKVYERAIRSFAKFKPKPGLTDPQLAWLYKIAHNLVRNHYRDIKRWRNLDLEFLGEQDGDDHPDRVAPDPEEVIQESEDAAEISPELEQLRAILNSLPEDKILILWLKFLMRPDNSNIPEFTNRDIAWILDSTESGIKSAYHRAVEKLKDLVSGKTL